MPFAALDADAIVMLSAVSTDALDRARKSASGFLSEAEVTELSKKIVGNLLNAFDLGERDPAALERAALAGISIPPQHW